MIKLASRLVFVLGCLALGLPEVYANCERPHTYTVYYYQRHTSCGPPDERGFRICTDYWSLDGQCTIECDGNAYCTGDTQMRSSTMTDVSAFEACEPVCE